MLSVLCTLKTVLFTSCRSFLLERLDRERLMGHTFSHFATVAKQSWLSSVPWSKTVTTLSPFVATYVTDDDNSDMT